MEVWRFAKNVAHSPVDLMFYVDSWIRTGAMPPNDGDVLRYFGILLVIAAVVIAAF